MSIPLQLGFVDYEQAFTKRKTRRQIFLDEMDASIPWDGCTALIFSCLSPAVCQGMKANVSFGGDAAEPLVAAVFHAV